MALHAEALLVRDIDYVVENGRLRLVSQSRGRIEALQRWPEGLQEAVEAKERLEPSAGVEVLDQLLVRDLVDLNPRMIGMSATLVSAAEELDELYGLRIGALKPNRPCIRVDEPDRLFDRCESRDAAATEFIQTTSRSGQPVLVATQSVAESERLAALLNRSGLQTVVLNAKNDKEEAAIIARAGERGRITVSTQMAGRGTDIRLGNGVADMGGLAVVGLSRFPSRRPDDQLRGRAGRQGDPGRSVFFVSFEDDLIAANAPNHPSPRRIAGDGSIHDRKLTDLPDQAQRVADGEARDLRKLARRYGMLLSSQRQEVLLLRRELLTTDRAWRDLARRLPERTAFLQARISRPDLAAAARLVLLSCLDSGWTDHLGYATEVREGIHLRALAREDPLTEFSRLMRRAFEPLIDNAYRDAEAILDQAPVSDGALDLDAAGLKRPGATWTYMVTDDHFGSEWERIGKFLAKEIRLPSRPIR